MSVEIEGYEVYFQNKLGSGTYGTVYKGRYIHNDKDIAAKCVDLSKVNSLDDALKEVHSLERVQAHANILKILHHCVKEEGKTNSLWLFTEYCENGDLSEYNKSTSLSLIDKVQLMVQCSSALAFMHNLKPKVIHRDIKPPNILITLCEGQATVKIADFGVAKDADTTFQKMTMIGTRAYIPPEFFAVQIDYSDYSQDHKIVYDASVDIFALAIVFHYFLKAQFGQELDEEAVHKNTLIGETMHSFRKRKLPSWSPIQFEKSDSPFMLVIKRIVACMMQLEPKDRISADQVKDELEGALKQELQGQEPLYQNVGDVCKKDQDVDRDKVKDAQKRIIELESFVEASESLRKEMHTEIQKMKRENEDLRSKVLRNESPKKENEDLERTIDDTEGTIGIYESKGEAILRDLNAVDMSQYPSASKVIKCVVVGDGGSGRHSLCLRFARDEMPEHGVPVIYEAYNQLLRMNENDYILNIHATAGQEDYDRLRPLSYPETDVFIIGYSVVSPSSWENVSAKWIPEIQHHCSDTPFIIVGLKTDLRNDRECLERLKERRQQPIAFKVGEKTARKWGASSYVECSPKNKDGLTEVFELATRVAISPKINADGKKKKWTLF